jgi:hypothetical protein
MIFTQFSCFELLLIWNALLITGVWFCCFANLAKVTRERPPRDGCWHKLIGERPSGKDIGTLFWDSGPELQNGMQSTVEFEAQYQRAAIRN